jgi:uncharacterized repeat protein (TIGR03803 family)
MTSLQRQNCICRIEDRVLHIALTLAALFALCAMAAPVAQAQTYHVIYNFTDTRDGAYPSAGVTLDRAGSLYGTTTEGGNDQYGTVYKLKLSGSQWTLSPLYSFSDGDDGSDPTARVIFGPNGTLYGTTSSGTVYNLRPPTTFCRTVICFWTLTSLVHDLHTPGYGDLLFDSAGNIYGTTVYGGSNHYGEVFELTPSAGGYTENTVFSFDQTTGVYPKNGVVFDQDGRLYGTTYEYGPGDGVGTVFQLTKSGSDWNFSLIYSFVERLDGAYPYAGVIFDSSYNLYGATSYDGPDGHGTIFEMGPENEWNYNLLCSFTRGSGGPRASLTMDANGNLYGTNYYNAGTGFNMGSIFKMSPNGDGTYTYTDLHDFAGGPNDGEYPISNVSIDANGNLFGTASEGGQYGYGIVWEITPN